jgi:hypothetical protein
VHAACEFAGDLRTAAADDDGFADDGERADDLEDSGHHDVLIDGGSHHLMEEVAARGAVLLAEQRVEGRCETGIAGRDLAELLVENLPSAEHGSIALGVERDGQGLGEGVAAGAGLARDRHEAVMAHGGPAHRSAVQGVHLCLEIALHPFE